jgi:hypothetical protein
MDLVEEDEAEDLSHPWDTPEQVPAVDVVCFDLLDDVEFEVGKELVEEVEELEIDLAAFADGGIGEVIGESLPVRLVGDLLLELGEVVLAISVLDVGEELGALSHEVVSAAQQIPG